MRAKKVKTPYLVSFPGRTALHIRDGEERFSTGTADRSEATAVLLKYIAEGGRPGKLGQVASGTSTMGEVMDVWGKNHEATAPDSWHESYKYVVGRLNRHAGHKSLEQIDIEWSRSYKTARFAEGAGNASVRKDLQILKSAWSMCKREKLISLAVPDIELPPAGDPRQAFLTKDQARSLIAACHLPHLRMFVRIGFATGGRPGAILSLPWSRVDFDKMHIDLRDVMWIGGDKIGTRVRKKKAALVPFDDGLFADLKAARAVAQTEHVIEFAGSSIDSVRRSFKNAAIEAELDPVTTTPYVMRHSVATWMVQDGVPYSEIAGFLGHMTAAMVEKVYGHHSPHYMKRALKSTSLD